MVAAAQRSRASIRKLADVVAGYFVPIGMIASVVTFVVWAVLGPEPALAYALINAVAVLIIACPCALGLATPMSIMTATGRGATLGVLFKDAVAIEVMRQVDTLVVDKTGTLTEGKPTLSLLETIGDYDEAELLRLAASLEKGSEHPLASAIVNAAATFRCFRTAKRADPNHLPRAHLAKRDAPNAPADTADNHRHSYNRMPLHRPGTPNSATSQ